jgi:hypothetical protein
MPSNKVMSQFPGLGVGTLRVVAHSNSLIRITIRGSRNRKTKSMRLQSRKRKINSGSF